MSYFSLGCEAEYSGDYASAKEYFFLGGQSGDGNCWIRLGYMLHEGIGGPVDDVSAIGYYKKAWRYRNSLAAYNIALMYEDLGKRRLSFRWMKRSADAGYGTASLALARAYVDGYGVRKSYESAADAARIALAYKGLDDEERAEAKEILEEALSG
jgi:TPR repeat protein